MLLLSSSAQTSDVCRSGLLYLFVLKRKGKGSSA